METKTCLECDEKIIGRADKKFCDDSCRNTYNNKLKVGDKNLVRNINNRLKKNYTILCELNPEGKVKVTKNTLLKKGFYFDLFTSIYTTKDDKQYFFCYNQGYLMLDNDYVLLVENKKSKE